MLSPLVQLLGGRKVILASGSPRRKQILENIGFPFEVVPSNFEENKVAFERPWEYAEANAIGKAEEVAKRMLGQEDWAVVVGADTIVISNDQILGKPGNADRAREMLTMLSGHTHQVCTGIALVRRRRRRDKDASDGGGGQIEMDSFHEVTDVTFAHLEEEVLESYITSGEPLDKAGGYGIQGLGGTLVQRIEGDYFNVVGLPLHRFCVKLLDSLRRD